MKPFVFLLLLLTFSVASLPAQDFLWDFNSDHNGQYCSIEGFPDSELPDGADSIIFPYFQEEAVLGWAICKDEKVYLMKKFDQEDGIWFNWAKANYVGTYENGSVQFCSQMPFRATIACDLFKWTGETFTYFETDMTDPSADAIDKAAALRKAGKLCEAIDTYNDVMYPSSYFNPDNLFAVLLLDCHDLALDHYRKKEYTEAVRVMDCIVENGWIDFSYDFVEEGQWTAPDTLPREKYIDIMGDYGLFLVRAKQFEKAVKINQKLIEFAPDVVGPLLQLGDAQFQLGQVSDAKNTYGQYHTKMFSAGKSNKIPSRVKKRM